MSYIKYLPGYELHSNVPLPSELLDTFNKHIVILLKPFIRQHYFTVETEKEWGMTQTQCYERCLDHDIMAFGLIAISKKYIILSAIGHRAMLNFQKYYHIYKPIQLPNVFLVFPFTMILTLDISTTTLCNTCGQAGTYSIGPERYCLHKNCTESTPRLTPRNFSFGKLVLSLDDIINYKFSNTIVDEQKMKCKHCRYNKTHKKCSYDRTTKNIKLLRDRFLS